MPCISNPPRREWVQGTGRASGGFVYETRNHVEEVDVVAALCQPECVGTSGTANIQDFGRRWRRVALDQLSCARLLQLERPLFEPRFFRRALVVIDNRRVRR